MLAWGNIKLFGKNLSTGARQYCSLSPIISMLWVGKLEVKQWLGIDCLGLVPVLAPSNFTPNVSGWFNPLAVADAVEKKAKLLRTGDGPALLDIECYRYSGHSTTDTNAYRSRDELKAWQAHDRSKILYQEHLIKGGLISAEEMEAMTQCVAKKIEAVTRAVVDRQKAPAIDLNSNPTLIGEMTFNGSRCDLNKKASDLLTNPADSKIVQSIERKSRTGVDEEGKILSPIKP